MRIVMAPVSVGMRNLSNILPDVGLARWWRHQGRVRWADLDPAIAGGVEDRLHPVVHLQLFQDRGHVVLDRLLGNEELGSDLFIGEPLSHTVEDFDLADREGEWLVVDRWPDLGSDGTHWRCPVIAG